MFAFVILFWIISRWVCLIKLLADEIFARTGMLANKHTQIYKNFISTPKLIFESICIFSFTYKVYWNFLQIQLFYSLMLNAHRVLICTILANSKFNMSKNRKNRKKTSIQKRKTPSKEELIATLKANSAAPAPIKMGYYEVEMENDVGSTFEEKLNSLRILAKEAAGKFPEKFQSLQNWLAKYDQPKFLSFCFYYFGTAPAGYDEEAVTGTLTFPPFYQELLQAFALTLPRSYNPDPFSNEVTKFKKDFAEVAELYKLKHLEFPDDVKSIEDLPFHLLRTEMIMHTTAVRNWSYDHQMKRVTLDLACKVSNDFIIENGFDPVVFLELLYKMVEEVESRINVHRSKTREFLIKTNYNSVIDTYENLFPVDKTTATNRIKLYKRFNKNLKNLKTMFLVHSDYFLEDLFTFDFETLSSLTYKKFSKEMIKDIFEKISLSFGELEDHDNQHFILGNPVHQKPFILVSENSLFSTMWSVMTHFSIGLLESFCYTNDKLRRKYNDARANYLENKTVELFKKAFPNAQIFAGSKWNGNDNKQYENDLLVLIGKFALVIEAKAGTVSPPAKRGAPDRLFRTLKELIEEPSDQALRFIEFLKQNPKELSLKVKKGPNNRFNASDLKYFIPIGITLSHLGMTSTNLKQLIEAGVTQHKIEDLAPSISLTDLEIIFDLLQGAAEKIHYFQRRRELEANIKYIGDELDLLAWYLDDGFNLGKDQERYGLFKMDLKAKELDNYIIGAAKNETVIKPSQRKTKWWVAIISRLEQKQPDNWLEMSYILNNVQYEDQQIFQKMADELAKKVKNGKAELRHNWVLLETGETKRHFAISCYFYNDKFKNERDDIIGEILNDEDIKDFKGKLVIAINVDKQHYPYSVLGYKLSPELFENRFLKN